MAILAAVVCLVLAVVLLFFPTVNYWLFQIKAHETGDFTPRRATMMFAPAAIGGTEFLSGGAGLGILVAVGTELFFYSVLPLHRALHLAVDDRL